jgi:DNA-binding NarL/FixJ family response regulator
MRVMLVGSVADRARLRAALPDDVVIVGEAATAADARAAQHDADAWLIAAPLRPLGDEDAIAEPLTPREREVLDLMAEGLPNKAIAARLAISGETVKSHVAAICGKLQAANRTEAVRLALRRGLVTI